MRLRLSSCALIYVMSLLLAIPAFATPEVLYENGIPTLSGVSPNITMYQVTDPFTIGASSVITGVNFYTLNGAGYDDTTGRFGANWPTTVVWSILDSGGNLLAGGKPVTLTTTAAGTALGYYYVYADFFPVADLSVGPGNYFLRLEQGGTASETSLFWEASNSGSQAVEASALVAGPQTMGSQWFQILGPDGLGDPGPAPVPEPTTMSIVGSALLIGARVVRKRR